MPRHISDQIRSVFMILAYRSFKRISLAQKKIFARTKKRMKIKNPIILYLMETM
jgi:hypothetical protein